MALKQLPHTRDITVRLAGSAAASVTHLKIPLLIPCKSYIAEQVSHFSWPILNQIAKYI